MDETVRNVAWAIAEAFWRKKNRVAAGSVPQATTSSGYADDFWQAFVEEAKAAITCLDRGVTAALPQGLSASVARI